jgi:hypothetical protein
VFVVKIKVHCAVIFICSPPPDTWFLMAGTRATVLLSPVSSSPLVPSPGSVCCTEGAHCMLEREGMNSAAPAMLVQINHSWCGNLHLKKADPRTIDTTLTRGKAQGKASFIVVVVMVLIHFVLYFCSETKSWFKHFHTELVQLLNYVIFFISSSRKETK